MTTSSALRQGVADRPAPASQYSMTYRDLDTLPDYIKCYELWEGEFVVSPAPTIDHQTVSRRLLQIFAFFDPGEKRGVYFHAPTDVVLREDITVQPDILYISNERRDIIKERHIFGAPDVCIEILSPSTTAHDINRKRRYYREAGVREYWLVDPFERTLTVYDLTHDATTEHGAGQTAVSAVPALNGLRVEVDRLFAAP